MSVRALDQDSDWSFGQGRNNYIVDKRALAQTIQTRTLSFLGDCFFDITAGIDWLNLLGGKDKTAIDLAVSTALLNTPGVTGILALSSRIDNNRKITVQYNVQSVYGNVADEFQYNVG